MNMKTIYIKGLPPYVQAGLRLHVTPEMSFDQVQRMAHNLGTSLRQMVAQVPTIKVIKTPAGVKPLLARGNSVQLVGENEESETVVADNEQMTLDGDAREIPTDVHCYGATSAHAAIVRSKTLRGRARAHQGPLFHVRDRREADVWEGLEHSLGVWNRAIDGRGWLWQAYQRVCRCNVGSACWSEGPHRQRTQHYRG
jgi:hypothetical protein